MIGLRFAERARVIEQDIQVADCNHIIVERAGFDGLWILLNKQCLFWIELMEPGDGFRGLKTLPNGKACRGGAVFIRCSPAEDENLQCLGPMRGA